MQLIVVDILRVPRRESIGLLRLLSRSHLCRFLSGEVFIFYWFCGSGVIVNLSLRRSAPCERRCGLHQMSPIIVIHHVLVMRDDITLLRVKSMRI